MKTFDDVGLTLAGVAKMYGKELSEFEQQTWATILKTSGQTPEQIIAALNNHLITSKWFPKPVDIIGTNEASAEFQAEKAAKKVETAVKHFQSVVFDDPTIHMALTSADFAAMKSGSMDDLKWKMKEFKANYIECLKNPIPHPKKISFQQYDIAAEPQPIGDINKAKLTWKTGEQQVISINNGNKTLKEIRDVQEQKNSRLQSLKA